MLENREGVQKVSAVIMTTSKASNPSGGNVMQVNVRRERAVAQRKCCSPTRPSSSLYSTPWYESNILRPTRLMVPCRV